MACCCKNAKTNRASTICLGRCGLPKHRCLPRYIVKPGPIPKNQGWLYNARDAPYHQLRCGWRPGHISCSVLRRIEQYYNRKSIECKPCPSVCSKCSKICHVIKIPTNSSTSCTQRENQPLIRIIRHSGQYSICTKPSNITNAPSSPYPLKYVLNTQPDDSKEAKAHTKTRFSVEAKYNNYQFDYTTSNTSFVLDFTPPEAMDLRRE